MPFHVQASVARTVYRKEKSLFATPANEDHTGWFLLLKTHNLMLRDVTNFFWDWYYSSTFQVTGKTTANTQLFPSLRNKVSFHSSTTQGRIYLVHFPTVSWGEKSKAVASPHLNSTIYSRSTAGCAEETILASQPLPWIHFSTSGILWQAFSWQIKSQISRSKLILLLTNLNKCSTNYIVVGRLVLTGFWPFTRPMTLYLILLSFICLLREEI